MMTYPSRIRLPVASGPPPDVPVYLSLGDLSRHFVVHRQIVARAWYRGYLVPLAFLSDRPCFGEDAIDAMRRYLSQRMTKS